jgi:hypothetical protein
MVSWSQSLLVSKSPGLKVSWSQSLLVSKSHSLPVFRFALVYRQLFIVYRLLAIPDALRALARISHTLSRQRVSLWSVG